LDRWHRRLIAILLTAYSLQEQVEAVLLFRALGSIVSTELVSEATDLQTLPLQLLNELLTLILIDLPLELLQEINLALQLAATVHVLLSQMITYALANFDVMEDSGSLLLIGLPKGWVLGPGERLSGLITNEVAVARVLRKESLLLLARKLRELVMLHNWLLLKLELVVLVLTAIWLQDVVNVVDLGMVHLVVRLGLLHALADLQSGPAIAAKAANIGPICNLWLHLLNVVFFQRFAHTLAVHLAILLVVNLHDLLRELLERLVVNHLALIAEGNCVAATELVQDFCGWLRSLLAEEIESGTFI